jgi:hypothetical protein
MQTLQSAGNNSGPAQECHFPPDNFFTSNGEEEEEMHAWKNWHYTGD